MMSVDYARVGARIKIKRKESGYTQEQLAEKLSVTVGYVSQIERGVTKINLDMLARISEVIHTDIAYFVNGTATGDGYLQAEWGEIYARLTNKQKRLSLDFMEWLIKHDDI